MKRTLFVAVIILMACYLLYKSVSYLVYVFLKERLANRDLEEFERVLGKKYKYKPLMNGVNRCKWIKGFVIIKASFDMNNQLIRSQIQGVNLFKWVTEISLF